NCSLTVKISSTKGARVSRFLGNWLAAKNIPAAPSRKREWSSTVAHFKCGIGIGSALGGAGLPLRNSLRVFVHSSFVHLKYLPKRPSRSCISLPHLSHSRTSPS